MDNKRERWELLTAEEQAFLKPLEQIHYAIINKYQYISEKKANSKALNNKLNEDFRIMCADQGIDTDRAISISAKLFKVPWYCYFITDVEEKAGGWQNVFSLCTHKNPNKIIVLQPDKYPSFYEAAWNTNTDPDTAYPAILDSLRLTHDYKYIGPTHYEVLQAIAEVYTNYAKSLITPRDLAREQGALQTIHRRLLFPSEKELEKVFTGYHVKRLPPGNNQTDIIKIEDPASIREVFDINPAILGAILKMVYSAYTEGAEDNTVKFQVTPICRDMNIDYRPFSKKRGLNTTEVIDLKQRNEQRMTVLANDLRPFESYMILLDNTYYKMLSIESYDLKSDVMTVRAPAFFKILENISLRTPQHSQFNYYFHSSVATEENTAAVEVAQYLGSKLLQMGNKNIYKAKYATIIQNNPQLKMELDAINSHGPTLEHINEDGTVIKTKYNKTQTYNVTLKRILETAYRIILEKSDFPQAYIDFKINGVSKWADPKQSKGERRVASQKFNIPTKTRLGDILTISHKGKNPQYVRPEKQ